MTTVRIVFLFAFAAATELLDHLRPENNL